MVWVDNARIIAAFAVVLLHVSNGHLEVVDIGTDNWWITNILDSAVRWCVPVFVMLSGLLLLDPEKIETTGEFYRKRASRILLPLVFWSAFYLFWLYFIIALAGNHLPLGFLLKKLLSGTPYYHMWFVYMIVGLYLVTPFLRKLTRFCSRQELLLLTVIMFLMAGANFASLKFHPGGQDLLINWFLFYLPYYFAGYLIGTTETGRFTLAAGVITVVAVAATAAGFSMLSSTAEPNVAKYIYGYLSITVIPMSLGLLVLLQSLTGYFLGAERTGQVAACSFGIYLVHPIFIDLFALVGISPRLASPLFTIPLISIAVFLLSLGMVNLIISLPYLRRVV